MENYNTYKILQMVCNSKGRTIDIRKRGKETKKDNKWITEKIPKLMQTMQ